MTKHKATPEHWSGIERFAKDGHYDSCLLELRSRVEALELSRATTDSAAPVTRDRAEDAPESSDSLVEQVADGIAKTFAPYVTADKPARAAIHSIADWLDQQELHVAATRLRMEVERCALLLGLAPATAKDAAALMANASPRIPRATCSYRHRNTMTTDFRALCAELLDVIDSLPYETNYRNESRCAFPIDEDVVFRARAALVQPGPEEPTDEALLAIAAASIDPYQDSVIAIGEYEPETERVVEVYGSELIAYGRAVLARWGK